MRRRCVRQIGFLCDLELVVDLQGGRQLAGVVHQRYRLPLLATTFNLLQRVVLSMILIVIVFVGSHSRWRGARLAGQQGLICFDVARMELIFEIGCLDGDLLRKVSSFRLAQIVVHSIATFAAIDVGQRESIDPVDEMNRKSRLRFESAIRDGQFGPRHSVQLASVAAFSEKQSGTFGSAQNFGHGSFRIGAAVKAFVQAGHEDQTGAAKGGR